MLFGSLLAEWEGAMVEELLAILCTQISITVPNVACSIFQSSIVSHTSCPDLETPAVHWVREHSPGAYSSSFG